MYCMTLKVFIDVCDKDKLIYKTFFCYFPYFCKGYNRSPLAYCANSNISPPYTVQ
jgi:hypothetical protein